MDTTVSPAVVVVVIVLVAAILLGMYFVIVGQSQRADDGATVAPPIPAAGAPSGPNPDALEAGKTPAGQGPKSGLPAEVANDTVKPKKTSNPADSKAANPIKPTP